MLEPAASTRGAAAAAGETKRRAASDEDADRSVEVQISTPPADELLLMPCSGSHFMLSHAKKFLFVFCRKLRELTSEL